MADETVRIVIEGSDQLSRPAQQGSKALSGLQGAAKASTSALGGLTQTALGFAAAMGGMALVGRAFEGVKGAVIGFNASMEQSAIAWTTLLKSGDAAKQMLDDLYKFAAATPFEFPELEQASKRLLAMGFAAKDIIPMMKDIGNAASALGAGAFGMERIVTALGQMRAKGKVSAEEMNQLAEMGVPAWQMLADAMGKPIPVLMKMAEQGKISAQTMIDAFRKFSQQNYGGMMEAQSRTFLGVLSTIRDNLRMTAATAFQPLFAVLSESARRFSDFVSSADFTALGRNVSAVVKKLIQMFAQLSPAVQQGIGIFAGLAAVAAVVVPAVGMLAPVIGALLGPIGLVAAAVAGLYVAWQSNFLGIRDIVASVLPYIEERAAEVLGAILTFFEENLPKLQELVAIVLANIEKFWNENGETIATIVKNFFDWVVETFKTAFLLVGDILDIALAVMQGNWDKALVGMGNMLGRAWNYYVDTWRKGVEEVLLLMGLMNKAMGIPAPFAEPEYLDKIRGGFEAVKSFGAATAEAAGDQMNFNDKLLTTTNLTLKGRSAFEAAKKYLEGFTGSGKTAWQQLREMERQFNNADAALSKNNQTMDAAAGKAQKLAFSLGDLVNALVALNPATQAAAAAVEHWKQQIDMANLAIQANNDQLKAAQAELKGMEKNLKAAQAEYKRLSDVEKAAEEVLAGMQQHLAALNEELAAQKQHLSDLGNVQLVGMGAFDSQIAAIERQIKRLRLVELRLPELPEIKAPEVPKVEIPEFERLGVEDIQRQYAGLVRTIYDGGRAYQILGISADEARQKLVEIEQQHEREVLTAKAIQKSYEDAAKAEEERLKAAREKQLGEIRQQLLAEVLKQYPELTKEMQDYLATLPPTKEGLEKALEQLQLMKALKFEEALAKIKEAAEGVKGELTFEEAMKQIADTKDKIANLTAEIGTQELAIKAQQAAVNAAKAAMEAQQKVIDSINASMETQRERIDAIQEAGDRLNETLKGYQKQLEGAEAKQKLINQGLELAYKWYIEDRAKVIELGGAGVAVADTMDEKTKALLESIDQAASDTTATSSATLATLVENYKRDMAVAASEVGTLQGKLDAIPRYIETKHVTIHEDKYVGGGGGGGSREGTGGAGGGGEGSGGAAPGGQHGLSFVVGGVGGPDSQFVRLWATPGERVTVTPPGQMAPLSPRTTNNYYNLTINSPVASSVVQDFAMLKALAGA